MSIDTLRADHLGCYGYPRATSPHIDALAREGVVFERAYSPTSWTLPGHASMLTGLSPYRHGALDSTRRVREDVPLLAERLRRRGYHTAAMVNAPFVQGKYGFSRGFDRFEEVLRLPEASRYQVHVQGLLESLPRQPFFVFLHYISVHSPYTPPPRFNRFTRAGSPSHWLDGRRLVALAQRLAEGSVTLTPEDREQLIGLYDGEILAVDDAVRATFETVRRFSPANTLVVVTSDHGEEFLEHGGLTHGTTLYDEVLHVPLIVAGPGVAKGHRVRAMVSLMDVVPTVLELAAVPPDPALEGRSAAAFLRGGDDDRAAHVVPLQTSAHNARVRLRGLRSPLHKLIADDATGRQELYDLVRDPAERRSRPDAPEAARLTRLLEGLRALPSAAVGGPSAIEREVLRSLGYQ